MNIVQLIMDQLSGAGLGKVSALLGESEAKTEAGVKAAVPALLSGLSSLASTGDGAQKLTSALTKFDGGSLNNLGNMLSGPAGAVADRGNSILNSLFSGNILSGISSAVGKVAGLGGGAVKNLLGYLAPLVLGTIAKQFAGKAINANALGSFFSEQKSNISNAIPSGLTLPEMPGLASAAASAGAAGAGAAARATVDTGRAAYGAAKGASGSAMRWLVPVLGVAALALIAWLLWPKSKPDVAAVTKDLTGNFTSLTSTLTNIKDAASADAAVPKLTELAGKFEGMKAVVDKLPEDGKKEIVNLVKSSMGKQKDQLARVLTIPGVSDKLRPALEGLVTKVCSVGNLPATQFPLPSVEMTKLSGDLSAMFPALNESLSGIKDVASAEAAVPKLTELAGKFEGMKALVEKLPDDGKKEIVDMVKSSMGKVSEQLTRVLMIPGVSDKLRPACQGLVTKVASMGNLPAAQFALPSVEVTKLGGELFPSLTESLSGIKDATSAEAAVPKLNELARKFEGMKALVDELPDDGKKEIVDMVKSSMGKQSGQLTRVLMIPGVSDKLRPALQGLVTKVASVGSLPAAQFALPPVEVTKLGGELSTVFSSLNESLSGIKDAATAKAALPKLKAINAQLDAAQSVFSKLPADSKATIGSIFQTPLANLKTLVTKVPAPASVTEEIMPIVDQIVTKLSALGR